MALRPLVRRRAQRLEPRAPHILPMQQALWQRQSQLSQALSDVTGDTGQRLICAMVAGERAPHTLAALRHERGTKAADAIALALTGTWREAPLCVLTHALALFDVSTAQVRAGDAQLARVFSVSTPRCEPASPVPAPGEAPRPRRRQAHSHRTNAPAVNTRAPLLRLTGVDLVAVDGISDALAQTILADIGTARSQWPDDTHCGSWLGLAPSNAISGGKVLKSRTMNNRNRAAPAFRMAAQSVVRSHGAFGTLYRRLNSRRGPAQARVATAHKIARTVYHMLTERVPSHDIGAAE